MDSTRPVAPGTFSDIVELIGNTPMVELGSLDTGVCRLFGKLELCNPTGSIKDRIGKRMIEEAEADGLLEPGGTIIEATAGNTGIALALVANRRGYKLVVVMPDKMSQEKIDHLQAMGATVVLTRSDVGKSHPGYYQNVAEKMAQESGAFYVNQFANHANVMAHYETTGPEVWEQMNGQVDALVVGVGTGGTLTGMGRYLREKNPHVEIILADPKGSILAPLVATGEMPEPGSWLIEGIGEDFVPSVLDLDLVTKGYEVTDADAFHAVRDLLATEGIFAGSSTGVLLAAALRYCKEQVEPKNVVVLIPDTGNKYLRKMFSDFWMTENGFIEREEFGDLRDVIGRRHIKGEDFTLLPTETLAVAHGRLKLYDVSQLPVVSESEVVGIIDESDILLAVGKTPEAFADLVNDHMVRELETLEPNRAVDDLLPIFRAGKVALIADADTYYGLITQIDLLNYLRRRAI